MCRDFTLQEIVEMQLLEDQQAARFVAAWLEIRMELGTFGHCEDDFMMVVFHFFLKCSMQFSRESLPRKVAEASRLCSWTMMAR